MGLNRPSGHCTDVRFGSFLSGGFTIMAVINPSERKLAKRTSVKRIKISSLEIIIFELKNDGKKWSRIYFEIDRAPSELLLPSAKISAQIGRIGLAA